MNRKVTIGLCVKNASSVLQYSLGSVSSQDYPHKLIKLIAVDNGSNDNTLSILKKFAKCSDIDTLVTSSKGKGLAETRQIAVDNAEGDYIVWVDDDYLLSNDFISKHVNFMENNPEVGAARPIVNLNQDSTFLGHLEIVGFVLPSWNSLNPKTIGTGGAIFRLRAIKGVNGFDIKIKGAGEDQDISQRIREAGWNLTTNQQARLQKKKQNRANLRSVWRKQVWYGHGYHFLFHKFRDKETLFEYSLPYALLSGFKTSNQIYSITKEKRVFFFTVFHLFTKTAQLFGYLQAHVDGYGHSNS